MATAWLGYPRAFHHFVQKLLRHLSLPLRRPRSHQPRVNVRVVDLHGGVRHLCTFQARGSFPTKSSGSGVLRSGQQAEETGCQRLHRPQMNTKVLHGRFRHAIELHQLLHLIIDQWRMRRRLELLPERPLRGICPSWVA